jgi:hypothetical protein
MKRLAQLQRPVRAGEIRAYGQNGNLVHLSSEAWLRRGPTFSTLFMSRDAADDVLLTIDQATKLMQGKAVYAQLRGNRALLERVA